MGVVIVDLTVSLDGFIAGPGDGPSAPLGRGGEPLFAWMMTGPRDPIDPRLSVVEPSRPILDEWRSGAGAIVSGRRTFDIANGWAGGHPIDAPIFVLTHQAPTSGEWSPRVRFVTEGFDRALALAREAAGDGAISLNGADVAQQALRAGVLDEIQVSVVPLLLGGGVRLFDGIGPVALEQTRVIPSDGVTHLRYRVVKE
ncbi:dihydrofolate reductase family protein [Cryptosporangium phraense]|uniref:dihydrofolate reductase family protein n=1 Tax=Cryptosporangium phraense TaxID=2593070 RepID=UPI0014782752|nr:dihydrofolate reductase family protein [Cryptosporangium phraense]